MHPVCHLVLGDSCLDLRVGELLLLDSVQGREVVKEHPPPIAVHARRVRQVEHRISLRAELDALVATREETAAPQPRVERLADSPRSPRGHHDERRQVFVLGSKAVGKPRSDARAPGKLRSGLEVRHRRVVIDRLGMHRSNERELVGDLRRIGEQLADPCAGLAALLELKPSLVNRKRRLRGGHASQSLTAAN